MRNYMLRLWDDDRGSSLVTGETLFLFTIFVLGVVVGLVALRQAVNSELTETANAILSLDQSYSISGQGNCEAGTAGSAVSANRRSVTAGLTSQGGPPQAAPPTARPRKGPCETAIPSGLRGADPPATAPVRQAVAAAALYPHKHHLFPQDFEDEFRAIFGDLLNIDDYVIPDVESKLVHQRPLSPETLRVLKEELKLTEKEIEAIAKKGGEWNARFYILFKDKAFKQLSREGKQKAVVETMLKLADKCTLDLAKIRPYYTTLEAEALEAKSIEHLAKLMNLVEKHSIRIEPKAYPHLSGEMNKFVEKWMDVTKEGVTFSEKKLLNGLAKNPKVVGKLLKTLEVIGKGFKYLAIACIIWTILDKGITQALAEQLGTSDIILEEFFKGRASLMVNPALLYKSVDKFELVSEDTRKRYTFRVGGKFILHRGNKPVTAGKPTVVESIYEVDTKTVKVRFEDGTLMAFTIDSIDVLPEDEFREIYDNLKKKR